MQEKTRRAKRHVKVTVEKIKKSVLSHSYAVFGTPGGKIVQGKFLYARNESEARRIYKRIYPHHSIIKVIQDPHREIAEAKLRAAVRFMLAEQAPVSRKPPRITPRVGRLK